MTEQEKAISQLCLEMQYCCEELRNAYCIEESYCMDRIGNCIEQIHRLVNPDFDKICEDVEAFERAGEEQDDERRVVQASRGEVGENQAYDKRDLRRDRARYKRRVGGTEMT